MRVLGINGSLRRGSYNRRLLLQAAGLLPEDDVEFEMCRGIGLVPAYDPDLDGESPPDAAERLRARIDAANALLIATPEYNGSVPGPLKNAIDWASRPFPDNVLRNKPVAVIGASTGQFGAVWAQAELRKILGIAGARVLDAELAVPGAETAFDSEGVLRRGSTRQRLAEIVGELCEQAAERKAGQERTRQAA